MLVDRVSQTTSTVEGGSLVLRDAEGRFLGHLHRHPLAPHWMPGVGKFQYRALCIPCPDAAPVTILVNDEGDAVQVYKSQGIEAAAVAGNWKALVNLLEQ